MKTLILGFTALTMIAGSASTGFAQTKPAAAVLEIRGLEKVAFDQWTKALVKGSVGNRNLQSVIENLQSHIETFSFEKNLFASMMGELGGVRLQNSQDYQNLSIAILGLRQNLRQRLNLNDDIKRDSLFMLELMAEEVLYVASKKFADFPKEFAVDVDSQISDASRTNVLRGIPVQTGDLLLSKSTGSGSSSFIALSMKDPHLFSHSTPIYVERETRQLLSPEAFIEDGVKLRTLEGYQKGDRTRLSVYRYKGLEEDDRKDVHYQVQVKMDEFVNLMKSKVEDVQNEASFGYDFGMDPIKAKGERYFCSGLSYDLYPKASANDLKNPYAERVWSRIVGGSRQVMQTLGITSTSMPAPGDVELNPLFELVGTRIDVTKLEQERIEGAIIDLFLVWSEANKAKLLLLASRLQEIANTPVSKEYITTLANQGLLPADKKEMIIKMAEQIPDGVNLKQLVFFYTMNDVMTPKIREQVVAALAKTPAIEGPLEIRRIVLEMGQGQMDLLMAQVLKKTQ